MTRISKDNYYCNIALEISKRGTCLRRNYGSIIVKNDEIISTGYTGSPRGWDNCCDINKCIRKEKNIPHGERYELCMSVHSEVNAIISAPRKDMIGSILYIMGRELSDDSILQQWFELDEGSFPCLMCRKIIANAGIEKVFTRKGDGDILYSSVKGFKYTFP